MNKFSLLCLLLKLTICSSFTTYGISIKKPSRSWTSVRDSAVLPDDIGTIPQTAVPLNYARHCLRSLTFWLLTLPFALVKDLGLGTGPICGVVSWVLFGVYQIGHSIEDPFQKTLQLSILCNAIRQDVMGENYISNLSAYRFDSDKKSEHALGKQHQTKQSMEDELFDLPTSSAPNPTDHMIMSSPRLMANGSNLEVMTS